VTTTATNLDPACFFAWMTRQAPQTVGGRLSLRLFADLAAARLADVPTSLAEVKEWAATVRKDDAEVQDLLPVAVRYWKRWLASTSVSVFAQEEAK